MGARRIKNRKKRKLNINYILILIAFALIIMFLFKSIFGKIFRKRGIDTSNFAAYFDKNYNLAYTKNNKNLYFQKSRKENDQFFDLDQYNWNIKSLDSKDYEQYIFNNLKEYFDSNNLDINSISLYIENNRGKIIGINQNKINEEYKIQNIINFISAADLYSKDILDINDSVEMTENDFVNGSNFYTKAYIGKNIPIKNLLDSIYASNDSAALRAINRYLSSKNASIEQNIKSMIKKEEVNKYSSVDTVKALESYVNNNRRLNPLISDNVKTDESLFLNSIYTNVENINFTHKSDSIKYDFGYVNSTNPYYYSIYSDKLSERNISDIGDIINRTIDNIETKKVIR